jgi:hypothetical protein
VHGIYQILTVVPYCFFPLILAQRASTAQAIPASALFYSLRREAEREPRLDLAPHYVLACILAASTTSHGETGFVVAAMLLVIGLVARSRPLRYRPWQWLAVLVVALALALLVRGGLLATQRALESTVAYWLNQFPWTPQDPNKAITAIGTIGRLKLSDQIRVRVTPHPELELPLFLHEASFDEFRYGTWTAGNAAFVAIDKLPGRDAWPLGPRGGRDEQVLEITRQHRRELALLPVPAG